MPRDIRSYFSRNTKKSPDQPVVKSKKRAIISSDEDEPKLCTPLKRTKLTKKSNKHHVLSDSDDEVEKQSVSNNKKAFEGKASNKEQKVSHEKIQKPEKTVTPGEMFGKKPIQREAAPKVKKKLQKMEAEIHNDKDFEATLSQLDTSEIEEEYFKSTSEDPKNKSKETHEKDKVHDKTKSKENVSSSKEKKHDVSIKDTRSPKKQVKKENEVPSKQESPLSTKKHDVDTAIKKTPNKGSKRTKTSSVIEIEPKKLKKDNVNASSSMSDEYEEGIQRKKNSSALYQKYLQRGGARNPGSKEVPEGAEYCLAGLSFLITGVLDSLEREEADELIIKYGGRILQQVSKKTDYVIVGDEPGPAKLAKANDLNIKKISEDDLLEMIRTRPKGKAEDVKQSHSRAKEKIAMKSPETTYSKMSKISKPQINVKEIKVESVEETKVEPVKEKVLETFKKPTIESVKKELSSQIEKDIKTSPDNYITERGCEAMVEKYRPKTMKQILGQQGDKSPANKLYNWLLNWHKNQNGNVKHAKPSPWAKNDDGAFFKAALLSGPPGIGKTTTAQVVCNELGFDLLEFNASDTRSKKLLKEEVCEILSNTTMKSYFTNQKEKKKAKHVLLMDEVDGMAGNEDRGGLQELINLIKSTDVPIICICNDRNNPKMRTLGNYVFDLKYQKPRLEQIRGAMKTICYKESIQITTEQLDRLIESTNQDIRQVINHLALLVDKSGIQEKAESKRINKDLKLGPWDVVRKVFSSEEHKNMSIHDKSDLFFHDYNIAGLFVQENYLSVLPDAPKSQLLDRVAEAAESLALGDVVEKQVRSNNSWSLLPVQACYSSVIPGTMMSGHIKSQINFPSWLGRNSKRNKFDRLLQEITVHSRLTTGASKEAINLCYLKPIRDAIVRPLAANGTEGVDEAVAVMTCYHLLREDLDSLVEVSLWPGQYNPLQAVDSKILAAFTRSYNKSSGGVPYAINSSKAKKSADPSQEELIDEATEGDINSDEEEDNVDTDKMIKAKKPTAKKKAESTSKKSEKPAAKRGRGGSRKK